MSAFVASAIVLPALLALAPAAIAQDAPPVAPATGHSFVTDARGLELGASSGILFIFLTFGGHVARTHDATRCRCQTIETETRGAGTPIPTPRTSSRTSRCGPCHHCQLMPP